MNSLSLSMRRAALGFVVLAGVAALGTAVANPAEDRSAAISACRAELSAQLGLADADDLSFAESRTRGLRIDVVFAAPSSDSGLNRYACRYDRRREVVVGLAAGTRVAEGNVIATAAAASR